MDERSIKILEVKKIILERNRARAVGEFAKSDLLRDRLDKEFGVTVIDQKDGPSGWKFKDGSSNKLKPGMSLPIALNSDSGKRKNVVKEEDSSNPKITKKARLGEKLTISLFRLYDSPLFIEKGQSNKICVEQSRNSALLTTVIGAATGSSRSIQGVLVEDIQVGNGRVAHAGDRIGVSYVGKLKVSGKVFDASGKKPFVFRLGAGEVIRGWDLGLEGLAMGGRRRLTIPPEKAYGKAGHPPTIPPNSTLLFEVSLLKVL